MSDGSLADLKGKLTAFKRQVDGLREFLIGEDRFMTEDDIAESQPMFDRLNTLEERVDRLEAENERLRDRVDQPDDKNGKIKQIVKFAENKREKDDRAVKLTAADIKGATGVSRRYAYDLIEDLPEDYEWFVRGKEMRQYGEVEMDVSAQQKTLAVDFEGVHSTGCPVNKFTTTRERKEGSA